MLTLGDTLYIQTYKKTGSKGCKKTYHVNSNYKKAGMAIIISYKIDFKTKRGYQRHRRIFCHDKNINTSEDNSYKHKCI